MENKLTHLNRRLDPIRLPFHCFPSLSYLSFHFLQPISPFFKSRVTSEDPREVIRSSSLSIFPFCPYFVTLSLFCSSRTKYWCTPKLYKEWMWKQTCWAFKFFIMNLRAFRKTLGFELIRLTRLQAFFFLI